MFPNLLTGGFPNLTGGFVNIASMGCFSIFMIILLGLITGMFSEYDTKNRKAMGAFLIFSWMLFGALLARVRVGGVVNCILFILMIGCLLTATLVSSGFATRDTPECSETCEKCKEDCKPQCKECTEAGDYKIDRIGGASIAFFVLASLMGSSYYTYTTATSSLL